jgi:hypothetical protein
MVTSDTMQIPQTIVKSKSLRDEILVELMSGSEKLRRGDMLVKIVSYISPL